MDIGRNMIGRYDVDIEFDDKDMKRRDLHEKIMFGRFDEILDQQRETGTVPDTYGCDCFFAKYFINYQMEEDFPVLACEFLKREFPHLSEYYLEDFTRDAPEESTLDHSISLIMMNVIYGAYKKGNASAAEFLKSLYKTYYRKEYQSLKRFRKISVEEIQTLCTVDPNEEPEAPDVARILCIAPIFGIILEEECAVLHIWLNDCYRGFEDYLDEKVEGSQFDGNLFQECREQIQILFKDEDDMFRCMREMREYLEYFLSYESWRKDYVYLSADGYGGITETMVRALAVMKTIHRTRTYTRRDIAFMSVIMECTDALISQADKTSDVIRFLLGLEGHGYYDEPDPMLKPDKIFAGKLKRAGECSNAASILTSASKPESSKESLSTGRKPESKVSLSVGKKPAPASLPLSEGSLKLNQDALAQEVEGLRSRLRNEQQLNRDLRIRLKEVKQQNAELESVEQENENLRMELHALREHVYALTEDHQMQSDELPIEEKASRIRNRKIVVIGGNQNWVKKVKQIFPDWNYIQPKASGSITAKSLNNADYIYFFTDVISHATYRRFISTVRSGNVPFGYIHGINLESNIAQIYGDLFRTAQ